MGYDGAGAKADTAFQGLGPFAPTKPCEQLLCRAPSKRAAKLTIIALLCVRRRMVMEKYPVDSDYLAAPITRKKSATCPAPGPLTV